MNVERERKFIVKPHLFPIGHAPRVIWAGYFAESPAAIRATLNSNGIGRICFKTGNGEARIEVEKQVEAAEAGHLIALAPARLSKMRFDVDGWEVDQFLEQLSGLWLAEWEEKEGKTFPTELPCWIGEEVTEDARYSNAALAFHGYPSQRSYR